MYLKSDIMDIFQKAAHNAKKSLLKNQHGAVIFNGSKVYATGYNKNIFFLNLHKYGYDRATLHAEIDTILKIRKKYEHLTLLVVRLGKTKLRNSKPCKSCMAVIQEVGIERVIYSDQLGMYKEMWL